MNLIMSLDPQSPSTKKILEIFLSRDILWYLVILILPAVLVSDYRGEDRRRIHETLSRVYNAPIFLTDVIILIILSIFRLSCNIWNKKFCWNFCFIISPCRNTFIPSLRVYKWYNFLKIRFVIFIYIITFHLDILLHIIT